MLLSAFALAALPLAPGTHVASGTVLDGPAYAVTLSDAGVVVACDGETLATVDGPTVALTDGVAEQCSVAFDVGGARQRWVGLGAVADWAGRPEMARLALHAARGELVATCAAGALLVETHAWFGDDGQHLFVEVTLTNAGAEALTDVFYTREWSGGAEGWTFPPDVESALLDAPADLRRATWMVSDMEPGESRGCLFSYAPHDGGGGGGGGVSFGGQIDLPLRLWKNAEFPDGLVYGNTNGVSWGDYDADGWIDVFACASGNLWRNLDGAGWMLAADLDAPGGEIDNGIRYGSAFADYNADGFPDITTEPRNGGNELMHLLRNRRDGPKFLDVADDPAIVDVQPFGDSETACWADVDGDGHLDLFLPVYEIGFSPGNFFLHGRGPTGPQGAYRFEEKSEVAQLDNPPWNDRPEGAQFVDADEDGDVDLYSNGTFYKNDSVAGTPLFDPLKGQVSGITGQNLLDEGCAFWDYDLDGDFDFGIAYTITPGVVIFDNRGDGTFVKADEGTVDQPLIGLNLGLSYEDWDSDGDIDFTTRDVFRRNMLMETGVARYEVASHTIPGAHITSATPAWGDWDLDGDLDCALGNWASVGRFYENVHWSGNEPAMERRYVRVRVMRDSDDVPDGLETEFGAAVEVHVHGDPYRRRRFVATGSGYLNQNEYVLTFALPNEGDDVVFDVSVEFTGDTTQGRTRVDRHVNPLLYGLRLSELDDREITVFRSGRVILEGCDAPAERDTLLVTTTDGLIQPKTDAPLTAPVDSPTQDHWIGLEFDTSTASGPVRLTELIVDGRLGAPAPCPGGAANVLVWDVSGPAPVLVPGGALSFASVSGNRRHRFAADVLLAPGKLYRVVARAAKRRATPIVGPVPNGVGNANGGLFFVDSEPCTGVRASTATLFDDRVYLAVRLNPDPGPAIVDLGQGLGGPGGAPVLTGEGSLRADEPFSLAVEGAPPNAPLVLVIGFSADCAELFGGRFVPALDCVATGLTTDAEGRWSAAGGFPGAFEPGQVLFVQCAVADPSAPQGIAFTNAIGATARP